MRRILAAAAALLIGASAFADTIAIIGTGEVGSALGARFAEQGHTIVYGSREPERDEVRKLVERTGRGASAMSAAAAASKGDIVVLAVPGLLVEEITRGLGELSGKIIIDPTNPLKESSGRLEHAVATSNAEIIQSAALGAKVVKAFNTLNWKTMVDPASAGGPVSIPLAGDDPLAKRRVADLVSGMGLEPIDVGPLEDARWVEGMLILWINNRYTSERPSFDFHLRRN
jgi:NADPH-dependent F420 reductase